MDLSRGLAIAIVTHDSLAHLRELFPGHAAVGAELGAEVVVADNGSEDGSVEFLREWESREPGITVLTLGRNLGYAAAVNAAFDAAGGEQVLLVNPDVALADPSPVTALVEFLDRNPKVAVAGPRLAGAGGETQPSARWFPSLLALAGSLPAVRPFGPARRSYERYLSPSYSSRPLRVEWVIGAAMLIRRRAFEEVGGWDERYFLYMEDADFCRRCAWAGWEVVYVPSVTLRHGYARASSQRGSVLSSAARRRHVWSLARFFAGDPRLLIRRITPDRG